MFCIVQSSLENTEWISEINQTSDLHRFCAAFASRTFSSFTFLLVRFATVSSLFSAFSVAQIENINTSSNGYLLTG